jgi:hypothetical protein
MPTFVRPHIFIAIAALFGSLLMGPARGDDRAIYLQPSWEGPKKGSPKKAFVATAFVVSNSESSRFFLVTAGHNYLDPEMHEPKASSFQMYFPRGEEFISFDPKEYVSIAENSKSRDLAIFEFPRSEEGLKNMGVSARADRFEGWLKFYSQKLSNSPLPPSNAPEKNTWLLIVGYPVCLKAFQSAAHGSPLSKDTVAEICGIHRSFRIHGYDYNMKSVPEAVGEHMDSEGMSGAPVFTLEDGLARGVYTAQRTEPHETGDIQFTPVTQQMIDSIPAR